MKLTAETIFEEYLDGRRYHDRIGLNETVRQNENFYRGNQWEGLLAPDLDKPVMNFLKRVVQYLIAMLVSDNIAASILPQRGGADNDIVADVLSHEVDSILERNRMTIKNRDIIRDAAVNGDAFLYCYYDRGKRAVLTEVVENTRVYFGNPYAADPQGQPYIIIERPMMRPAAKREAERCGADPEAIRADGEEDHGEGRVTVLTRFWRDEATGHIFFARAAKDLLIKGATDTGYRLYPVANMAWDRIRDCYHGQAVITGLIPNQIVVNKLWAMAVRHQQTLAFPKVFFDRLKIREWSNRPGEAVGVTGNPNEAVAGSFRAGDMSAQLLELVDRTIRYSRDFLGASDASLGNVRPDNTSAILALQKASSAPLELQRLGFHQFVEEYVRIMIDIMRQDYGVREVRYAGLSGEAAGRKMDFSGIDPEGLDLKIDVGASSYWSEIGQMETMDNLFAKGIITDAVTYIEGIPAQYLKNKNRILAMLRERGGLTGPAADGRHPGRGGAGDGMSLLRSGA